MNKQMKFFFCPLNEFLDFSQYIFLRFRKYYLKKTETNREAVQWAKNFEPWYVIFLQ